MTCFNPYLCSQSSELFLKKDGSFSRGRIKFLAKSNSNSNSFADQGIEGLQKDVNGYFVSSSVYSSSAIFDLAFPNCDAPEYDPRISFFPIPCSKCDGCRMKRSKEWAARCYHEMQCHAESCFVTLTYNKENLPQGSTLVKKHFTDFNKRFRRRIKKDTDRDGIKFFMCGEYGDKFSRPHYHALFFGYDLPDREYAYTDSKGIKQYTSAILSEVWGKGFVTVGDVTFQSAAYVSRYILKKVGKNEGAVEYYGMRVPEYVRMSNRPGLGRKWIEKYFWDVYTQDTVVINDKLKLKPPRFYDNYCKLVYPDLYDSIKSARIQCAVLIEPDTPQRLADKEEHLKLRISKLVRGYENGTQSFCSL